MSGSVFAERLREMALRVIKKYGEPCTLTYVTNLDYDPNLGSTTTSNVTFDTYSSISTHKPSVNSLGETNLNGMKEFVAVVPWFGAEIDQTWLYNGSPINKVIHTIAQGKIITSDLYVGHIDA